MTSPSILTHQMLDAKGLENK